MHFPLNNSEGYASTQCLPHGWQKTNQNKKMKNTKLQNTKALLAGAALAGIMTGGFLAKANAASTGASFNKSTLGFDLLEKKDKAKGETHDCAGKNSCKGKGGCKTGDAGCAGKNTCKGKGGCAVKDGKPAHEGEKPKGK